MAFQNVTATSPQFQIKDPEYVFILSPNSGTYTHVQNISVSWNKVSFTENVDLYWTTSTAFSTSNNITTNYASTSFTWDVPSSLAATSVYIWVRKTSDSNVKDRSNSAISITGNTIYRTIAEPMASSDSWTKASKLWAHTRTLTEGITSSDSWTKTSRIWKYIRTLTEGITSSDSWAKSSRLWKHLRTLAEGITSSDSWSVVSRIWKHIRTIAEPVTTSESSSATSRLWKKFRTIAEPFTVSDSDSATSRLWIKVRAIAEGISALETSSVGHLRVLDEILAVSDSWTVSLQKKSTIYQLNAGGTDESFQSFYKTGWIMPKTLSTTSVVRRINIDYLSGSALTVKVYKDDDIVNPMTTKTFNASSSIVHETIRLGTRVKYFLISIETTQASNETVRIERIEIEVDD
jgi:hypothetical protein